MSLKDPLRAVLVPRFAGHIGVTPHQIPLLLPAHRRELLDLLAFPRLMLNPGILFLWLVGSRQRTPLGGWQLIGQAIQHVGPLVVTDTPAAKASLLDAIEVF